MRQHVDAPPGGRGVRRWPQALRGEARRALRGSAGIGFASLGLAARGESPDGIRPASYGRGLKRIKLKSKFHYEEYPLVTAKPGSLAALPLGGSAVVSRVRGDRAVVRRLLEVGLVPGTKVTLRRIAPLGDPIELKVRNFALSIRRAEALGIEIE